jgi:hypothetical protein
MRAVQKDAANSAVPHEPAHLCSRRLCTWAELCKVTTFLHGAHDAVQLLKKHLQAAD